MAMAHSAMVGKGFIGDKKPRNVRLTGLERIIIILFVLLIIVAVFLLIWLLVYIGSLFL